MAKKIQNSDIVAPNLLTGAIKNAKDLLLTINSLEVSFKKSLKVQEDFLKTSKVESYKSYKQTEDAVRKVKEETEQLSKIQKDKLKIEQQLLELTRQEALEAEKQRIILKERKKAIQDLAKEELGLISAYDKQSIRLKNLQKGYQNLVALGRENGKVARGMKIEIDRLDKSLKNSDASVGKFNRNVGNYTGSIIEAAKNSNLFGGKIGGVISGLESFGTKAGVVGGIISGVLIAALAGLNLILTQTEAGLDFVEKKAEGLRAATKELGVTLKNMSWQQWLMLFFNTGQSIGEIATKLNEARKAGEAYAEALDKLEDIEINNIVGLQKLNEQISLNKLAMEDANLTIEEKIALAKEAIDLDEKLTGVSLQNGKAVMVGDATTLAGQAQSQLDAYRTFFGTLTEPTSKDKRKLAELEANVSKVLQEAFEGRKRLASQIENLERQLEEQRIQRITKNREREIALIEDDYERERELIILKYDEIYRQAKKNKEDLILVEKNKLKELEDLYKKHQVNIQKIKPSGFAFLDSGEKELPATMQEQAKRVREQAERANEELKKIEEQRKEELQKQAEFIKDLQESVTDSAIRQLEKEDQKRKELLDKEIDQRKTNIEIQEELAEKGLVNTLVFEKKKLAEAELEQERLQKKKERREKVIAYYKAFAAYLDNGEPGQAAAKALAEILTAEIVSGFFFEGTENVEKSLGNKGRKHLGRDGYRGITKSGKIIAFDGDERIMSAEQNKLIGSLTNDELAMLAYNQRVGAEKADGVKDSKNYALLTEMKKLNSLIEKKKEVTVNWNSLDERVEKTVEYGMKKTVKYIRKRPSI